MTRKHALVYIVGRSQAHPVIPLDYAKRLAKLGILRELHSFTPEGLARLWGWSSAADIRRTRSACQYYLNEWLRQFPTRLRQPKYLTSVRCKRSLSAHSIAFEVGIKEKREKARARAARPPKDRRPGARPRSRRSARPRARATA